MSHASGIGPARGLAWLDRSGASVSSLCALHCAVTPLLVAILPAIGLGILADERTEWVLLSLSGLLAVASLGLGWRVHRSPWILVVVAVGLGLLAVGRWAEEGEGVAIGTALTVGGGLAVASAHLLSRRLCGRACRRPEPRTAP